MQMSLDNNNNQKEKKVDLSKGISTWLLWNTCLQKPETIIIYPYTGE